MATSEATRPAGRGRLRLGPRAQWFLGSVVVLAAGGLLATKAFKDRRAANDKLDRLMKVADDFAPMAARMGGTHRRVLINGSPMLFGTTTVSENVSPALDRVRGECEKGDLGVHPESDKGRTNDHAPAPASLVLTNVERQDRGDVGAELCTFRDAPGRPALVRWSLAHRVDDHTTSLFTVATEATTPLDALFPAEGDVGGGDIAGVPRPSGSRRTFAATIEGEAYDVRIYEAPGSLADAVHRYDAQMTAAGWQRSAAVAAALPDVRSYALDRTEVVASFEHADDVTRISIAPVARP